MNSHDWDYENRSNPHIDPDVDLDGVLNVLQVYDCTTRTWQLKARMYQKRYAAAAAVRDGRLYVIGGEILEDEDGMIYQCDYCTYYNPEDDAWYNSPDLPSCRLCSAACAMGGLLTTALPSPDPDSRAVGMFSLGTGYSPAPSGEQLRSANYPIVLFGSGSSQSPAAPLMYGLDETLWDYSEAHKFLDYFSDTDGSEDPRERRDRILAADDLEPWDDGYVDFERAMDAGSDSDLEPDERWWRRRLVSEEGRGKGDERSTRKAWREIPDCPPALHRISSPAVVTLELG